MVQTRNHNSKAGFSKSRARIISKNKNKAILLHKKSNANVRYISTNKTQKNNNKNKYIKKSLKRIAHNSKKYIGGSTFEKQHPKSKYNIVFNFIKDSDSDSDSKSKTYYYAQLAQTNADKTKSYNILIFVINNDNNNIEYYTIIPKECQSENDADNTNIDANKHISYTLLLKKPRLFKKPKELCDKTVEINLKDNNFRKNNDTKLFLLKNTISNSSELKKLILNNNKIDITLTLRNYRTLERRFCHDINNETIKLTQITNNYIKDYYINNCFYSDKCEIIDKITNETLITASAAYYRDTLIKNTDDKGKALEQHKVLQNSLEAASTSQTVENKYTFNAIKNEVEEAQDVENARKAAALEAARTAADQYTIAWQLKLAQKADALAATYTYITHLWYRNIYKDPTYFYINRHNIINEVAQFNIFVCQCYDEIKSTAHTTIIQCPIVDDYILSVMYILLKFYNDADNSTNKDIKVSIFKMITDARDAVSKTENSFNIVMNKHEYYLICTILNIKEEDIDGSYNDFTKLIKYPLNRTIYDGSDRIILGTLNININNTTKKIIFTKCPVPKLEQKRLQKNQEAFNIFLRNENVSLIIMLTDPTDEPEPEPAHPSTNKNFSSYINKFLRHPNASGVYDMRTTPRLGVKGSGPDEYISKSTLILTKDNELNFEVKEIKKNIQSIASTTTNATVI